jgi:hypothetical protein
MSDSMISTLVSRLPEPAKARLLSLSKHRNSARGFLKKPFALSSLKEKKKKKKLQEG